jgi:predicted acetyltransferase
VSQNNAQNVPVDQTAQEKLAAQGLSYRLVRESDLADYLRGKQRGFLGSEPTDETLESERLLLDRCRAVGVYDETALQPFPVATAMSWETPLTIPAGQIPMWAITSVTVAATHRRRGIARNMLEGELRAAKNAGFALAGLTVTEATIYGRYGFMPAAPIQRYSVDTRRAGWGSYEPAARVLFVDREQLAQDLAELHESTRIHRIGDIAGWERRWQQTAGLVPEAEKPRDIRGVRAIDAEGRLVGAMAFTIGEGQDHSAHVLRIAHLVTATADARAALWRFALSYDLVGTVTADLQPLDEPLPWFVADRRAITQTVRDHGWLRILDVPEALALRPLAGPVGVRVRVTDPLGLAGGEWTLLQLGGEGLQTVPLSDGERVQVTMDIGALSAAYLGAVRLDELADVGRVRGDRAKIRELSDALRTDRSPHLSIWY